MDDLRAACSRYTHSRTVQLFEVRRRLSDVSVSPLATGVLVRFADKWLVCTASHVLDSPDVQANGLVILSGNSTGFIDLGDFSFVRTASGGDRLEDDDIDLAILTIDETVARQIQDSHLQFAALEPLDDEEAARAVRRVDAVLYFVHGYPVEMTEIDGRRTHVTRVSLSVFLERYDGSRGPWATTTPGAHIDLDYQPGFVGRRLEQAELIDLPHPSGFSGCGLWQVNVSASRPEQQDIPIFLAGIIHRFSGRLQVLRATRLDVLLHVLNA